MGAPGGLLTTYDLRLTTAQLSSCAASRAYHSSVFSCCRELSFFRVEK